MSRRNTIVITILIIAVGIQFIQPVANKSSSIERSFDITSQNPLPSRVQAILENSCYDCHSNNTKYPWYAKIQPGAWWLSSHIKKGKTELNFSEFGKYSARKQRSELKGIASSIKDGSMPLRSYTWLHKNALLDEEEKRLIINWAFSAAESFK